MRTKRRVSTATLARLREMRRKYGLGEFAKRKARASAPARRTKARRTRKSIARAYSLYEI